VNGLCVGVSRFRKRHKPQGPAHIDKDLPHRPALDRVVCFWMRSRGTGARAARRALPVKTKCPATLSAGSPDALPPCHAVGCHPCRLDELTGRPGVIDEIAQAVALAGKVKGTARRAMSPALAIRFTLLMTLAPDADYPEVMDILFGDLVLD